MAGLDENSSKSPAKEASPRIMEALIFSGLGVTIVAGAAIPLAWVFLPNRQANVAAAGSMVFIAGGVLTVWVGLLFGLIKWLWNK